MRTRLATTVTFAMLMSGCVSMSGLTDNAKFACKAPDGVACTSVSGVFANAQQNNLPALQFHSPKNIDAGPTVVPVTTGAATFPFMQPGLPIRSQPRMLRLWIAPWRDDDDSLHDQSYVYVMVDSGKWMVERSRDATIQKSMTRLQQLGKPSTTNPPDSFASPPASSGQLAHARNIGEAQEAAREAAVVPPDGENVK